MEREYNLVCGACGISHLLTGPLSVMAAEIATFMAAHRDHDTFKIDVATTADCCNPSPDRASAGDSAPNG